LAETLPHRGDLDTTDVEMVAAVLGIEHADAFAVFGHSPGPRELRVVFS